MRKDDDDDEMTQYTERKHTKHVPKTRFYYCYLTHYRKAPNTQGIQL